MKLLTFMIFLCGNMGISGFVKAEDNPLAFGHSSLSIQTHDGIYTFNVEIARSEQQRARGLMYRKGMKAHEGMLFLFEADQMVSMWMKNTYIPLDIIFINKEGGIVHIAKSTVPHSLDVISSRMPVISALEVNGGVTKRLNITIGDRINHAFFGTAEMESSLK